MPFITDRDLLAFEPTLCRDALWGASELASGTGVISSGNLSVTGIDPGARGIAPGQLAVVAEEPYEITSVPGAGTVGGSISLSRPRPSDASPRIVPSDGTSPCRVITFAHHIAAAHELILQQLGIAGLAETDLLHESHITRTGNLKLVEACMALESIWAAAAGAAGPTSVARQRSEFYAQRAAALCIIASAEFDGGPAGTRIRLSAHSRQLTRG